MRKDNWRFEALARGRIAGQEKETRVSRNTPFIEDFKPAEEIERLQNINADLLEVCKLAVTYLEDGAPKTALKRLEGAISKAEGRDEG